MNRDGILWTERILWILYYFPDILLIGTTYSDTPCILCGLLLEKYWLHSHCFLMYHLKGQYTNIRAVVPALFFRIRSCSPVFPGEVMTFFVRSWNIVSIKLCRNKWWHLHRSYKDADNIVPVSASYADPHGVYHSFMNIVIIDKHIVMCLTFLRCAALYSSILYYIFFAIYRFMGWITY